VTDDITCTIRDHLPRDLLIDLYDMAGAQALKAFEMIRDHAGLDDKRARELVGQARFRMLEKGFVDVCELHGGSALPGGVVPGTGLRAFQPFMRFGGEGPGVVLGLASIPFANELPSKNQSRTAGVMLNAFLTPQLDLGQPRVKPGDIFVLFLVARDRARVGMIEEVAVGVVDHQYKTYLSYQPLDGFIAGYAPGPESPTPEAPPPSPKNLVRLKPQRVTYQPPEAVANDDQPVVGTSKD
jgi:hypothetical protein